MPAWRGPAPALTSCAFRTFFQVLSGVDLSSFSVPLLCAIQTVVVVRLLIVLLTLAVLRMLCCSAGEAAITGRYAEKARGAVEWPCLLAKRVVEAKQLRDMVQ